MVDQVWPANLNMLSENFRYDIEHGNPSFHPREILFFSPFFFPFLFLLFFCPLMRDCQFNTRREKGADSRPWVGWLLLRAHSLVMRLTRHTAHLKTGASHPIFSLAHFSFFFLSDGPTIGTFVTCRRPFRYFCPPTDLICILLYFTLFYFWVVDCGSQQDSYVFIPSNGLSCHFTFKDFLACWLHLLFQARVLSCCWWWWCCWWSSSYFISTGCKLTKP